MSSPFSILCAISVRENLPERSNTYIAEYLYFPLLHNESKTLLSFDIFFSAIQCTEDNDKLHEMLGAVEHIQKTDRIKKILTGCIRVHETANHDGEVELLLLELK